MPPFLRACGARPRGVAYAILDYSQAAVLILHRGIGIAFFPEKDQLASVSQKGLLIGRSHRAVNVGGQRDLLRRRSLEDPLDRHERARWIDDTP
jgi:hypothetical protein